MSKDGVEISTEVKLSPALEVYFKEIETAVVGLRAAEWGSQAERTGRAALMLRMELERADKLRVKLKQAVDMIASLHSPTLERREHCRACALYFELREQEAGSETVSE